MKASSSYRCVVIDHDGMSLVDVEDAVSLPLEPVDDGETSKKYAALIFLLLILAFFLVLVVSLMHSKKT